MSFSFEKSNVSSCVVFSFSGRILEADSIDDVINTVKSEVLMGTKCFIMDMAGVELLNSIGIGMLVRTVKAVNESGGKIIFTSVPEKIQELLRIIKLNSVMDIAPTVEEGARILTNSAK
jgi:anti-anti-sigma factor